MNTLTQKHLVRVQTHIFRITQSLTTHSLTALDTHTHTTHEDYNAHNKI
jgi:hypothetical protein